MKYHTLLLTNESITLSLAEKNNTSFSSSDLQEKANYIDCAIKDPLILGDWDKCTGSGKARNLRVGGVVTKHCGHCPMPGRKLLSEGKLRSKEKVRPGGKLLPGLKRIQVSRLTGKQHATCFGPQKNSASVLIS